MTDENPFSPPQADSATTNPEKGTSEYLRKIARGQRNVLLAILFQLGLAIANVFIGQMGKSDLGPILSIVLVVLALCNLVFIIVSVFQLAASLDGTIYAILWIVFSIIPCLGLIFLLILSQRATNLLTKNGIKVGLLGADPNSI